MNNIIKNMTIQEAIEGEYDAAVGYEHLIADFPDVESVKNDEKRHGDIVSGLLDL